MMRKQTLWTLAGLILATAIFAGCGSPSEETSKTPTTGETGTTSKTDVKLSGEIKIDGSSTVFKISQAFSEEFTTTHPDVKAPVSESGTSGGFKKFGRGEIDITGASRAIQEEEIKLAAENGVEFIELPVAFDGLTVVVNKENTWAETLTIDELKKIWGPGSTINNWKDVRPGFPDQKLSLFGPGEDSGTFDYFTEAVVGEQDSSRNDFTKSEDDNVLVTGVAGERGGMAYFGYAYYVENKDKLNSVKIDNGAGGVAPTEETIANGTYAPLSRPLFIYVNKKSMMEKPEVKAYVMFLLDKANKKLISESGYIPFPDSIYDVVMKRAEAMTTGTVFKGTQTGMKIEDILKAETGAAPTPEAPVAP